VRALAAALRAQFARARRRADTTAMRRVTILVGVAIAAGLAWLAQPLVLARLAAPRAEDPRPNDAAGAIDPTPYRDAIEAIESVLYREQPASWSDPEHVAGLAMQLGDRVYADLGPPRGNEALTRLVDFATSLGAQAESGFAAPELDGPRAAWEALRADTFRHAPWFDRTTAELVAAQRPAAPTASLLHLHELWKWAGSIQTLVDGGRPSFDRHGEIDVDVDSESGRALVDRWLAFARDWDARVQGVGALAPRRPPPGGEPNLLFAHQALEQAVQQLSLATSSDGDAPVPTKGWRAQCLDAAVAHLEAARGYLSQAHTGAPAQTASLEQ
jgi:hypothetical protein